ncbi:MAG TPA: GYF domain-containing protein [Polyangiaceae bacterium]|nr:GYF domain-containing protein [Polyangiaceae bacterium]
MDTNDGGPKPAAPGPAKAAASSPTAAPVPVSSPAKAGEAPKAAQAKPAPAAAEAMYIVGFTDDRQHPHTVAQIVELYSAGKIDDEALVWKDGMADWLSPFDVPELAAAFRAKNVAPRAPGAAFAAAEDEATLVVRSPLDDPSFAAAIAASAAAPVVAAPVAAAPVAAAPVAEPSAAAPAAEQPLIDKPSAARRVERRAGAVDLFGSVSEAGSEGDVSLDLGSSDERGHKLTGARNESSVLFSLDALTKSEPKTSKTQEKEKEKERAANEALFGESASDPLMNLGSSGLGALAAPDFTKPVSKVVKPVDSGDPLAAPNATGNKGRGGVILIVGFIAIAAAAAVAFVMMKKQPTTDDAVASAPSAETQARASAEPLVTGAPSANAAPAASEAPAASAAPATSASGASSAVPAASTEAIAATAGAAGTKAIAPGAAATPATPAAASKPAEPAAAAKAPDAPAAAAPAAAAPAATPEAAAFDKNAAVAALGAAAASAGSCKKPDGPTGSGKVSVTFAPSGRATATSVAGDLAGTEVGGCVARIFRAAKVPPFSGDPVTVSKSFTIQ